VGGLFPQGIGLEAKENGAGQEQHHARYHHDDKGDFLSNWAIAQMLHAGS
jgi:hypothetical protein